MVSLGFFIDIILPADSTSNRNEYQEYFLGGKGGHCIWLIILKSGSLNLLKPSGAVQAHTGIAIPFDIIPY
jgi:hypothetical protein